MRLREAATKWFIKHEHLRRDSEVHRNALPMAVAVNYLGALSY